MLAVLPARAALYVTAKAIFRGPPSPPSFLSLNKPNVIPASALERNHGVELLEQLGVELPERLKSRVQDLALPGRNPLPAHACLSGQRDRRIVFRGGRRCFERAPIALERLHLV